MTQADLDAAGFVGFVDLGLLADGAAFETRIDDSRPWRRDATEAIEVLQHRHSYTIIFNDRQATQMTHHQHWIAWMCCGEYRTFDDKQDAYETIAAYINGDNNHRPQLVEGPNGEDLTREFEKYANDAFNESYRRMRESRERAERTFIGTVDVKSPPGKWFTNRVFSEKQRDEEMREAIIVFGADRVRFTPVAKM